MAFKPLNWKTPFEALKGSTPDMIYKFRFWDKVVFQIHKSRGDVKPPTKEKKEMFCDTTNEINDTSDNNGFIGFVETVGHPLTYKILSNDTKEIIYRSRMKFYGSQ